MHNTLSIMSLNRLFKLVLKKRFRVTLKKRKHTKILNSTPAGLVDTQNDVPNDIYEHDTSETSENAFCADIQNREFLLLYFLKQI